MEKSSVSSIKVALPVPTFCSKETIVIFRITPLQGWIKIPYKKKKKKPEAFFYLCIGGYMYSA